MTVIMNDELVRIWNNEKFVACFKALTQHLPGMADDE
jgi:hypothetical protein